MILSKVCTVCKQDKPFESFYNSKTSSDGKAYRCKSCDNLARNKYRQNICRYYHCKKGGKLVKVMPPLEGSTEFRRIGIDTDWNVKVCNNIVDFDWDVDYDYYINESRKLVIEEK